MKALILIAAALLSGHHHLVRTTPGMATMMTGQACGDGVTLHESYRIRCVDGVVAVTRLYYAPRAVDGRHHQLVFRRLTAYNRSGRLVGWVDWRVTRRDSAGKHLAVGVMDWRTQGESWQFS